MRKESVGGSRLFTNSPSSLISAINNNNNNNNDHQKNSKKRKIHHLEPILNAKKFSHQHEKKQTVMQR